jgi:hypothetical protein
MKQQLLYGLVPIKLIADVTNTSPQNIHNTYLHNQNGRNKEKMLKALAYGAYMMEEKLTPKDLKKARKLVLALKEPDVK